MQPDLNRTVHMARRYRRAPNGGCAQWVYMLLGLGGVLLFCCGITLLVPFILPPIDILVIGIDARPNEEIEYARTDSILLLGIGTTRLSLLSIPRDLWIEMPGYGNRPVNTIHREAGLANPGTGPTVLKSSIEASFGVRPERFVRLNFEAFVALVDAVGGVEIDVPRQIIDSFYPTPDGGTQIVRFDPGVQWMDGERALQYARTRHADDDYERGRRQQQVVQALARRLINPLRWPGAAAALLQHIDTDLSPLDIWRIFGPLILFSGSAEQLVIDREYIVSVPGGAAPNYDKLRPWITEHFD